MSSGYYAFLVFLGGCSYGILSTIVKLAYEAGFTLSHVSGSQGFWGMALFWLVAWKWRPETISLKKMAVLIFSGLPMGLTSIFYYRALETLDASLAIIFLFQFVWIGTIFDILFFKKIPGCRKAVSILILLVGSVLASGLEIGRGLSFPVGVFWGALSAVSYSLVILASGVVGLGISPVFKSAMMSVGAAAVIFFYLPPVFLTDADLFLSVMPYGILLGLFGIVVPPFLFSVGIPKIGPGLGSILTASELPTALLMSFFVLHEPVGVYQWIGAALIFVGIVVGNVEK